MADKQIFELTANSTPLSTHLIAMQDTAGLSEAVKVTIAQLKTALALAKGDVGLGNVDNTSDSAKNSAAATLTNKTISGAANTISNIAQASITNLVSDLALKAPLASPTFSGSPTAPTASVGTNSTQIASTAFVQGEFTDKAIYFDSDDFGGTGSSGDPITVIGGGGGSFDGAEVLARGTITNASTVDIDFSSYYTAYDIIEVRFYALKPANDGANFLIRVSSDGSTFSSSSNYDMANQWNTTSTGGDSGTTAGSSWNVCNNVGNGAGKAGYVTMRFEAPNSATLYPSFEGQSRNIESSGTRVRTDLAGWYSSAQVLRGIRAFFSAGNITSGYYKVIGYSN